MLSGALAGMLLAGLGGAASAQDGEGRQATDGQEVQRTEARGRLPNYFSRFVTEEQRLTIYEIQARYHAQIAELEAQIEALSQERDQAVDATLTPEQLAEVNRLREEARQRRAARQDRSGSDDGSGDR